MTGVQTCALPICNDGTNTCRGSALTTPFVGTRYQYFVEALWTQTTLSTTGTTTSGTTGTTSTTTAGTTTGTTSTTTFRLTGRQATNFVTYLVPPVLSEDVTTGTFGGTSPSRVSVNINATLGANDYILELATNAGFSGKKTYRPFNPGAINSASGTQANPQGGTLFSFFSPTTGINLLTEFPGAAQLFARVGVRDSRNGTDDNTNPYVYTDPIQVPDVFVTNS